MNNTQHRVIGLGGKAGVGKDTLAAELAAYGYRRIAFADPLYEAISKKHRVTLSFLRDRRFKEVPLPIFDGRSLRQMLQEEGDRVRADNPSALTDILLDQIHRTPSTRYVITDIRTTNEADALRAMGIPTVRVLRETNVVEVRKHTTERDEWVADFTVMNHEGDLSATVADLFQAVGMGDLLAADDLDYALEA